MVLADFFTPETDVFEPASSTPYWLGLGLAALVLIAAAVVTLRIRGRAGIGVLGLVGFAVQLAAAGALVNAYRVRGVVEGAYFDRSAGAPAYAGVYSYWSGSSEPWIVVGALLLALGTLAWTLDAVLRSR